ncbi:MAG: hypothetical protein ACLTEE_11430 [Anaerobutyricum hallii]
MVVDRLLTGFNAPCLSNYLWIDNPLILRILSGLFTN